MKLKLSKIQELQSDKKMSCDAVSMFFDWFKHVPYEVKERNIVALFKCRKLKIQPTEIYLNIEVIDEETGELLEFNCKKGVHKYCMEKNIYPNYLSNILK